MSSEMAIYRRWWWPVLVSALAATLAIGIVEIALRYESANNDDKFFEPDAERGWRLRPGFSGWATAENRVWVTINSDGLRGPEHSRQKPPGAFRVAVLGDSLTLGTNVALEKTFPSFLESALNACPALGDRVEVLNFGVDGYGTAQELIAYQRHARDYSPDVVLLAFYTGNDLFNNHPALNPSVDQERSIYFEIRDGALARVGRDVVERHESPLWRQRARLWVTRRSSAAALLYSTWVRARAGVAGVDMTAPDPLRDAIYRPPDDAALTEAWKITEALLLELRRSVTADHGEFWITTLATAEQVIPARAERAAAATRAGAQSLFYPDRRLRDFAGGHGIPIVSLAEPLADYAQSTGAFLNGGYSEANPPGTGHWNEIANRVAADIIAHQLCAESERIRSFSAVRTPDKRPD